VRRLRHLRWWQYAIIACIVGIIAINGMAWMQAHSMLHYSSPSAEKAEIRNLSFSQRLRMIFLGAKIPRPINRSTPTDIGLFFETQWIESDGGALEAWFIPHEDSQGIVLLFPGYAASKASLLAPAATCRPGI